MRIGVLRAESLDDPNQRVLAKGVPQLFHRGEHGFVVSFDALGKRKDAASHRRARFRPRLPPRSVSPLDFGQTA